MVFDKKSLIIPDKVRFEEHNIVTKGDFIIGDRADYGLGVITEGRVFVGENSHISGSIQTIDDVRVDMWSEIDGNLKSEKDVFLADKVKVKGKVSVGKDLELSDSAEIGKFEAKGWINVRSPISLVIYMYLYLLELMRQGRSQEVELILDELQKEDEEFLISDDFLFVPNDSRITLQRATIKGDCRVGSRCRILGNYFVTGKVKVGNHTKFHGTIGAGGDVEIGNESVIVGNIVSKGTVTIGANTHIFGKVKAKSAIIEKTTVVDGNIQAPDGVKFTSAKAREIKVKVERFERGMDDIDAVLE